MKEPSVTIAGDPFPRIFVNLSPHYAYGWLWNLEGPRQIFLHDIEVVGERRKGIGRLMIQAFMRQESGLKQKNSSPFLSHRMGLRF